jgi:glycerophosphoryl diester phosphodiesterase
MSLPEFLDHPGLIPFAHRGGVGPWPENSWPAFESAVGLGYRYLETDVRVTRDDVPMIFHDAALDRLTGRAGRFADLSAAEAAAIGLAGGGTGQDTRVPRLDDLLGRWPEVRLNIDVKEPAALGPTLDALRRTGAITRVCLTSFDDAVVRAARRLAGPTLCVGAGMSAIAQARLRSVLPHRASPPPAGRRRPRALVGRDVVQVPVRYRGVPVVDARFVRYAAALGLPVHVWTVNDARTMTALLRLGVHGLITDDPALLRDVLRREGLWSS